MWSARAFVAGCGLVIWTVFTGQRLLHFEVFLGTIAALELLVLPAVVCAWGAGTQNGKKTSSWWARVLLVVSLPALTALFAEALYRLGDMSKGTASWSNGKASLLVVPALLAAGAHLVASVQLGEESGRPAGSPEANADGGATGGAVEPAEPATSAPEGKAPTGGGKS